VTTAVDSSVILSIYTGEPAGAEWLQILIGAHACIQADQLATDDAGFMRKYFSSLKLVGR